MTDDRDLVVAADRGQDGADLRIAPRGVEVGRPVLRSRVEAARRGVLDRLDSQLLSEARD